MSSLIEASDAPPVPAFGVPESTAVPVRLVAPSVTPAGSAPVIVMLFATGVALVVIVKVPAAARRACACVCENPLPPGEGGAKRRVRGIEAAYTSLAVEVGTHRECDEPIDRRVR